MTFGKGLSTFTFPIKVYARFTLVKEVGLWTVHLAPIIVFHRMLVFRVTKFWP